MYWPAVWFAIVPHVLAAECPPEVTCISTLKNECPEGEFFRDGVRSLNCCPGCVRLKGINEQCATNAECAPGLMCKEVNKTCQEDSLQSCEYYKLKDEVWTRDPYWQPDCLRNGKYAPKQCKGEGPSRKCLCMTEDGDRVFGEQSWKNSQNMTCACSRLVEEMRRSNQKVSIHCDENGNFELLQCDDHICWCSDERTGRPYTPMVPESMVRVLPCFDENTFGSQYLRQCDSTVVNTARALELLRDHGTDHVAVPTWKCNYDGSYARVQRKGLNMYCADKNGKKITEPSGSKTDCNCAYDRYVKEKAKEDFNFMCENDGRYLKEQCQGNIKFCVDKDGFPYGFPREGTTNKSSTI